MPLIPPAGAPVGWTALGGSAASSPWSQAPTSPWASSPGRCRESWRDKHIFHVKAVATALGLGKVYAWGSIWFVGWPLARLACWLLYVGLRAGWLLSAPSALQVPLQLRMLRFRGSSFLQNGPVPPRSVHVWDRFFLVWMINGVKSYFDGVYRVSWQLLAGLRASRGFARRQDLAAKAVITALTTALAAHPASNKLDQAHPCCACLMLVPIFYEHGSWVSSPCL